MTKKSPNVIFKTTYELALNNVDNKKMNNRYKEIREQDIGDMFDYISNNEKKLKGMFEYYMGHTRKENVNLVLQNGDYANKEDIKKLKEDYKKYIKDSNLWKSVISFNSDYINNNITIEKLEQLMAKEVLPQFFKYCGFNDINKMSYVFSVHTNKKNPHIHLSFIEKQPNYNYCDNKINYRRKGNITIKEQNFLKRLIELSIEREKYYTPLLTKTNKDIDELKTYFNPNEKNYILKDIKNIELEEKILTLGKLLKEYRGDNGKKIKYNSIKNNENGKKIKKLTREIKKYLFSETSSSLYKYKKDIDSDLRKLNNYFDKLNKDNNVSEIIKRNDIVKSKKDYIDNYIYNAIVNHSLFRYENNDKKSKITINDLILESIYLHTKNIPVVDILITRKNILENYFINDKLKLKLPNKYIIEKSLRNINKEMDKSAEEFSKLFDYEK